MVGEFEFIEKVRRTFADIGDGAIEGIGDDCAVIPVGNGESVVVTADLLTEGIHFVRDTITPEQLGAKSLAVNLSDVAAMGVRPFATLLSIALPKECNGDWADRFIGGYKALSAQYGVALIGGDTTSSESGITINVTALGRGSDTCIKRRSSAVSGDVIAVTGELGISARGLADVLSGRVTTAAAQSHLMPQPRVDEGVWLGTRSEVHSMMDLSDGLASDLPHILEMSGVGARIETANIPAPYSLREAVCGGEDYELLFTASPAGFDNLKHVYKSLFGKDLFEIGRITSDGGLQWFSEGVRIQPDWKGYSHF